MIKAMLAAVLASLILPAVASGDEAYSVCVGACDGDRCVNNMWSDGTCYDTSGDHYVYLGGASSQDMCCSLYEDTACSIGIDTAIAKIGTCNNVNTGDAWKSIQCWSWQTYLNTPGSEQLCMSGEYMGGWK